MDRCCATCAKAEIMPSRAEADEYWLRCPLTGGHMFPVTGYTLRRVWTGAHTLLCWRMKNA